MQTDTSHLQDFFLCTIMHKPLRVFNKVGKQSSKFVLCWEIDLSFVWAINITHGTFCTISTFHQTEQLRQKHYVDGYGWVCIPFCPLHCPSKRSMVPRVNVLVTLTKSFGVNRPLKVQSIQQNTSLGETGSVRLPDTGLVRFGE